MDVGENREAVGSEEETTQEQAPEQDSTKSETTLGGGFGDVDFDKIEDMSKIYEETLKNFDEGEVVRGTIVSVGTDSILVDIGFKSEGNISLSEFPEPDQVKVGDEIDVLIEVAEDQDGMIVLSKLKADKIKNWANIQKLFESNELVEGKIVRKVKGGFKVDIGLDAFLPASQIARRPVGDLDQYLGKTYDFRIIKLTKRRRNVVLSRKQVLEEARSEEKAKLLANLEIGQELEGTVKNITDFGAFIDVGGIDGLLHITDMSWGRIKHPSEVVAVGQQVSVKVLNFDKEEEKISLGLKQMSPNPWSSVEEKYPSGAVVRGKVVSMTDYGAFVQLEEGVEGMVHISEMSWTKRVRHPSEIVHIGQEVDVKLLKVDAENEKISLGLKQIGENPWLKMKERYPEGSIVNGLVRNLTDYGAFIQIEEGIDGLLHISDMSWTKKINHPSEVLKKGDEIDVQILNIDVNNEKISLGIKQLERDPWNEVGERYRVGDYVETSISKLVSFGAFARLDNGIEGLIHISELSKDRINKPEEVVHPGDRVIVKIISTDPGTRKIGLSLKQYKQDLEEKDVSEFGGQEIPGMASLGEITGTEISSGTGEAIPEQPDEPQAVEPQPVELQPEEQQLDEPQAIEPQPEEQQLDEPQAIEPQPDEQQLDEPQTVEPQPDEQQPDEQQAVEPQPDEQQPDEQQPDEQQAVDLQPDEQQAVEPQPDEQQPDEQQAVEPQPDEQQPDEQQAVEPQPDEERPVVE